MGPFSGAYVTIVVGRGKEMLIVTLSTDYGTHPSSNCHKQCRVSLLQISLFLSGTGCVSWKTLVVTRVPQKHTKWDLMVGHVD